jgi:hypothetical protein
MTDAPAPAWRLDALAPSYTAAEVAALVARARREAMEEAAAELRGEAEHLAADARDGVRNGSEPGAYEAGAQWVGWAASKVEDMAARALAVAP